MAAGQRAKKQLKGCPILIRVPQTWGNLHKNTLISRKRWGKEPQIPRELSSQQSETPQGAEPPIKGTPDPQNLTWAEGCQTGVKGFVQGHSGQNQDRDAGLPPLGPLHKTPQMPSRLLDSGHLPCNLFLALGSEGATQSSQQPGTGPHCPSQQEVICGLSWGFEPRPHGKGRVLSLTTLRNTLIDYAQTLTGQEISTPLINHIEVQIPDWPRATPRP